MDTLLSLIKEHPVITLIVGLCLLYAGIALVLREPKKVCRYCGCDAREMEKTPKAKALETIGNRIKDVLEGYFIPLPFPILPDIEIHDYHYVCANCRKPWEPVDEENFAGAGAIGWLILISSLALVVYSGYLIVVLVWTWLFR